MARGIDHIVLCSRDLDQLESHFERLGFTLTPRAQHPFGTDNQLAQLGGDFIELLGIARPDDITASTETKFSFGGYNQSFLEAGDGFSMIALKSQGWEKDRAHFKEAGLDIYEPFEFSRQAGQPDGSEVTVGFKLTIAKTPQLPQTVFFTCDHQHEPQYFYKPQFQDHANTATGISEVMMIADQPTALTPLFDALMGPEATHRYDDSLAVDAGQAVISVTSRTGISERFLGADIGARSGPRFVGYGVFVSDIETTEKSIEQAGLSGQRRGNSIWLCGPETGHVIIEFSQTQMAE